MPTLSPPVVRSPRRRALECVAFVALWMSLGSTLRLNPNAYLVIGIPLVVAFQMLIARKPIVALWVREETSFNLGWIGWGTAALLAAYPLRLLISAATRGDHWEIITWDVAAILGALACGFAFERWNKNTARALGYGLSTAGVIGLFFVLFAASARHWPNTGTNALATGALSFLRYLPVSFALEEVVFRGALDAHAHWPSDGSRSSSSLLVSVLWGAWHFPIAPLDQAPNAIMAAGGILIVHAATGIFLSNAWRSCGNLLAPAAVHALIDAVRNGLLHR